MSQYVTKIRTEQGDKQIDYNALANLPDLKNMFSNPNLLINSDFRNPVNQRGATSYKNTNSSKDTYNIDRWRGNYGTEITVNSGSITVAGGTSLNRYFYQTFEHTLSGTFTFSFNITNLQGNVSMYYVDGSGSKTTGVPIGETKMTFTATNLKTIGFLLPKTNGISMTINWAKLEVGSIATPFVPRLYAEELMLCQRYYKLIDFICSPGFVSAADEPNLVTFTAQCSLRAVPSIAIKKQPEILRVLSTNDVPTTLTFDSVYCKDGVCSITFSSTATLASRAFVWSIHEFKVELDAEIY